MLNTKATQLGVLLIHMIAYSRSCATSPTSKFNDLSLEDWEWQLLLLAQDTPQLTLWTYVRSKASCLNNLGTPNYARGISPSPHEHVALWSSQSWWTRNKTRGVTTAIQLGTLQLGAPRRLGQGRRSRRRCSLSRSIVHPWSKNCATPPKPSILPRGLCWWARRSGPCRYTASVANKTPSIQSWSVHCMRSVTAVGLQDAMVLNMPILVMGRSWTWPPTTSQSMKPTTTCSERMTTRWSWGDFMSGWGIVSHLGMF